MRGEPVVIPGDYQYAAATRGPRIQRFWHYTKKLAIARYLPPAPSDLIVDAGCGSGVITSYLGESGATVIGLDSNVGSIQFARSTFARENVHFTEGTVDRLALERPVDKIYCLEVLEHLTHEEAAGMLTSLHQALTPGGRLFLTTPNVRSLWPIIEWVVDRTGLVAPMGGAQHVVMYHARTLSNVVARHGFAVDTITSMCLLSPWAAAISRRLAEKLFAIEARLPGTPGPILVAVLRRVT